MTNPTNHSENQRTVVDSKIVNIDSSNDQSKNIAQASENEKASALISLKKGNIKLNFLALWAIVGPVIGGSLGVFLTYWQASVSQQALDRSTGKIKAVTEFRLIPDQNEVPALFRKKIKLAKDVVYFDELDRILALNPCVIMKNNGNESIDVLRVEIKFLTGLVDTTEPKPAIQEYKSPWVLRQFEREDHQLSELLLPGYEAKVSIIRGLVKQMVQAQATDERSSMDHYGQFEISCYGRVVGSPAFDASLDPITIKFAWLPKGFEEEKCKRYMEAIVPSVNIIKKRN